MHWRSSRRPSSMPIKIRTSDAEIRTTLLDVAEGGAKIVAKDGLSEGMAITLSVGRLDIPGGIVWQRKGAMGVAFETSLTASQQAELSGTF